MTVLRFLVFAHVRAHRAAYWATFFVLTMANLFALLFINAATESALVPSLVLLVITGYIWLVVCAARCRDMGEAPWWGLLTVIPFLGWAVALWLGFASSQSSNTDQP